LVRIGGHAGYRSRERFPRPWVTVTPEGPRANPGRTTARARSTRQLPGGWRAAARVARDAARGASAVAAQRVALARRQRAAGREATCAARPARATPGAGTGVRASRVVVMAGRLPAGPAAVPA